ncbi:hypothetical protein ig2599ANME_0235 [groundwater metagenome]
MPIFLVCIIVYGCFLISAKNQTVLIVGFIVFLTIATLLSAPVSAYEISSSDSMKLFLAADGNIAGVSILVESAPLVNYTLFACVKSEGVNGTNASAVRVVELNADKKWLRQTNLTFRTGLMQAGFISTLTSGTAAALSGLMMQRVRANSLDFTFYYIPKDRYIEIKGEMQDLRGEDRALQR